MKKYVNFLPSCSINPRFTLIGHTLWNIFMLCSIFIWTTSRSAVLSPCPSRTPSLVLTLPNPEIIHYIFFPFWPFFVLPFIAFLTIWPCVDWPYVGEPKLILIKTWKITSRCSDSKSVYFFEFPIVSNKAQITFAQKPQLKMNSLNKQKHGYFIHVHLKTLFMIPF